MKVLHIDSSILGAGSATRALTRGIVERLKSEHPDAEVTYLDLAQDDLPHLTQSALARSDASEAARNARALDDFLAADVLVIGAPIYNFSIPSQLKAWIDRIAVAGKTFRYTANGPEGLAGGKQVIVAMARGGLVGPDSRTEFGESYLRFLFSFLGIRNLRIVHAQGLAISPQHREESLKAAHAAIPSVARVPTGNALAA
ncbi:MAG TPA: NAD(P)H-dependent oxidoreductase [Steroidobacteraceae bacterium]|nr:NAD(P)H-dependent oxidoreductase [Steroidobacteraceae bacterium]